MKIITSHQRADFDAIASMLAAHKLYPDAVPVLPKPLGSSAAEFVLLYQNGLPFVRWDDFQPQEKITEIILVDTQTVPSIRGLAKDPTIYVIDHHPPADTLPEGATFSGDVVGAATTLLVERIRERRNVHLTSLEATLLALGIYVDTGSFTYGATTERDLLAAAWLMKQHVALDTVRRFMVPSLDDKQQAIFEHLVRASDSREIQGYTVTVATVEVGDYIEHVNGIAHHLSDMLDPEALFVVVAMPQGTQLVCRSRVDAINVGDVARYFGGGGHPRAAAATISDMPLDRIADELWKLLESATQPVTRVADLMSYGVQTLREDQKLDEVIAFLRRVGHEGYPVLDNHGHVAGLLSRRDADRAIEHGLHRTRARDVMQAGRVTLTPTDSVSTLEQRMVESGWGQIPVVDDAGDLIGIVTRTDLIQHWAKMHPASPAPSDRLEPERVISVMGDSVGGLIELIAEHACHSEVSLYLVGGLVRDLLLDRANLDIDFVIEGDAVRFAQDLAALYGGEAAYYRPFGTAKWRLDHERIGLALDMAVSGLPEFVDFATSRNEFYEHPTALPSVYNSSIKLDLQRRDFTINTLAIQLSPRGMQYRLLDFYGGMSDLRQGLIRVLHSLSFVDDPTRVLRAARFEHRLGFRIEARTAELLETARPMLRRITGQRLRDELNRLLLENEPEVALLSMQERGVLPAIHLAFHFRPEVAQAFKTARQTRADWPLPLEDMTDLYWHLIMMHIEPEGIEELAERLRFSRHDSDSFIRAAELYQPGSALCRDEASISHITNALRDSAAVVLVALWVAGSETTRVRIIRYVDEWQFIAPVTNGHTLKEMGLEPGPAFRVILENLRDARLDGEIRTDVEEAAMLDALIKEHIDDGA